MSIDVPGPDGLARPLRPRRVRSLAIVVIVIVVLAGAVGGWVLVQHGGDAAAGDVCPATRAVDPGGRRVPAGPTAALVDDRLVPDTVPDSVLLCEYTGGDVPSGTPEPSDVEVGLSRTATVPGGDAAVGALVAAARSAPVDTRPDGFCISSYSITTAPGLIALTYADGVVWISTPDICGSGATNGRDSTTTDLSGAVAAVLDSVVGAVPSSGPGPSGYETLPADPSASEVDAYPLPSWAAGCASDNEGGTQELLPWAPVSVRVCHRAPNGPTAVATPTSADHPRATAVALAAQLEALPDDGDLSCVDEAPHEEWALYFTDAAGDDLTLFVAGGACPYVENGQAFRVPDAAMFARLAELAPG